MKSWRRWIVGSAAYTPTTPAGLPLEHSDHQIERMIEDAGHRYGVDEAAELIQVHLISGISIDGRPWYFGPLRQAKKTVLFLSARPTATVTGMVQRIRTIHRRSKPPSR